MLSIWLHLPFTFVILYAARLAIPRDLYEAAAVDGARHVQQFRRITLPLLMPAMLIAMLFRYIFAFRLFSEVWLLTGGGPARQTEVLAVYLYLEAFRYNAFGEAAATGWLLVIASLILALWYLRRLYKEMFATYALSSLQKSLKAHRHPAGAGLVAGADRADRAVLVQGRPGYLRRAAAAAVRAHARAITSALWATGATSSPACCNSLIITVGATMLAVLTSAMAGYAYSRFRHRLLAGSAFFLIFIRLIPPIVITLPLFPAVNYLRLNDTHILLIVLYATFFVSLGTMVMRTFIDQIPRELDEAAHIDGASAVARSCARSSCRSRPRAWWRSRCLSIVYAWNEFLFAFIFTTTRAKTAPLVISEMFGAVEGVRMGRAVRRLHHPAAARAAVRRACAKTPGGRPDRRRDQGMTGMVQDLSRRPIHACRRHASWLGAASQRCCAQPLRPAAPDHRASTISTAGFCGWTQLVGNYEDDLDAMLPGYAQHSSPMLSTLAHWDAGSHGGVDGDYALKIATASARRARRTSPSSA